MCVCGGVCGQAVGGDELIPILLFVVSRAALQIPAFVTAVHFLLSVFCISNELVRKVVGFMANPSPSLSLLIKPNWQRSASASTVLGSSLRALTSG